MAFEETQGTAADVQLLPQLHLHLSHHRDCHEPAGDGGQPHHAVPPRPAGTFQDFQLGIGL